MQTPKLFCPNCGFENPMTAQFCRNCGHNLSQVKAEMVAAQRAKTEANQQAIYQQANQMAAEGRVKEAATLFAELGDFKDAQQKAVANQVLADAQDKKDLADQQKQQYEAAMNAFTSGDLSQAATTFTQLGQYQDAPEKLKLVQNALSQRQQQQQAQDYAQAYQAALSQAKNATTATALRVALTDLTRFTGYQDADQQRAAFEAKMPSLMAAEEAQHATRSKRNRRIGIISGFILVLLIAIGGFAAYHSHTVSQLNSQVAAQRTSNEKSFNKLPNTTQQDLRDMVATYHGNVNDYTYNLKQQTTDYAIVNYQFVGPDHSKDVLPSSGTRTYNQTAISRQ